MGRMATGKRMRFIHMQIAIMLTAVIFLALLDGSLELFFVVSLIGFLALVEITAPVNLSPRWRRRLRLVILLGLLGFGYIVLHESLRVLGIDPSRYLPWMP